MLKKRPSVDISCRLGSLLTLQTGHLLHEMSGSRTLHGTHAPTQIIQLLGAQRPRHRVLPEKSGSRTVQGAYVPTRRGRLRGAQPSRPHTCCVIPLRASPAE